MAAPRAVIEAAYDERKEQLMPICKRCGRPIEDASTESRSEWCLSMRRLLLLNGIQPEDYHPKCFIDALTRKPPRTGERRNDLLGPPLQAKHYSTVLRNSAEMAMSSLRSCDPE